MPVQGHAEEFRSPGTGENAAVGVLLSHGFTGSPKSMRPFGEHLAAAGVRRRRATAARSRHHAGRR